MEQTPTEMTMAARPGFDARAPVLDRPPFEDSHAHEVTARVDAYLTSYGRKVPFHVDAPWDAPLLARLNAAWVDLGLVFTMSAVCVVFPAWRDEATALWPPGAVPGAEQRATVTRDPTGATITGSTFASWEVVRLLRDAIAAVVPTSHAPNDVYAWEPASRWWMHRAQDFTTLPSRLQAMPIGPLPPHPHGLLDTQAVVNAVARACLGDAFRFKVLDAGWNVRTTNLATAQSNGYARLLCGLAFDGDGDAHAPNALGYFFRNAHALVACGAFEGGFEFIPDELESPAADVLPLNNVHHLSSRYDARGRVVFYQQFSSHALWIRALAVVLRRAGVTVQRIDAEAPLATHVWATRVWAALHRAVNAVVATGTGCCKANRGGGPGG